MGGCVSKKMSVEYDPQMKEKQKPEKEQEKRNSEASPFQAKLESDAYANQSGSKRALSLLFKQEENEETELLQTQSTEEKDTTQKYEITPPENALKSEKQESSRECKIQSVVIQRVETGDTQPNLQEVSKDHVKLETSTASSNVSNANESSHVQTENLKIDEPNLFTTTLQDGSASVMDNMTGAEKCITGDGNGIHFKTDEAGPLDASSFKDEKVNDNNEKSLKSGTDVRSVDANNNSAHKEDEFSDSNIGNNKEDTSKDSDAYIKSSQGPQSEMTVANDYLKAGAENGPSSAILPAGENYDLDTNAKNTVVGNCASDNVQVQSLVAEQKRSLNNIQDAYSDVTMPISCSVQDTFTMTENIDEPSATNHQKNSLLVKTEEKMVALEIQSNRTILADGSQEENIIKNMEAKEIQSNMAILADGSQEKASGWNSENANLRPNGDSQSNLVIAKTEEKAMDSKEAPVGEPVVSTVSTFSSMPSVFEISMTSERELEEKSMEEAHGTFQLVGEGETRMENKNTEALEEKVRELEASCQEDHSETKPGSQKSFVNKNVNKILGKDMSPSEINQERLSDSNLLVLESVPEENFVASPTNVGKVLAEYGNAFSMENIESPSAINSLTANQDLQSKDISDNHGTQVKSPEKKQE